MGLFSVPLLAEANFLNSLLGNEASANTDIKEQIKAENNSQNISLLQAKVSSVLALVDKKENTKNNSSIDNEDVLLEENLNNNIISNNALSSLASPYSSTETIQGNKDQFSDQVSIYVIRKGDSISNIAKMFGVSVNTIYWANDLKKGDKLKEGNTLVILPFDGLTHEVKSKETLASIAKLYKADIDDIALFNGISKNEKLSVGEELVIPDGQKTEENDKPKKNLASNNTTSIYSKNSKSVDGYFIYPLPTGPRIRKTQGIHDKHAIDIGAPSGTPIYAAASGLVVIARTGYNGGYGTFVVIKHPNGTESRYAHMSKLGTSVGKQVAQGEVIGYVGTTGRSTGNHLHIEIRGARNPF